MPSFHHYQGNTIKEAASEYPPSPTQPDTNAGASPELVGSKSGTDADADVDTDVDANTDVDADGADAPDDNGSFPFRLCSGAGIMVNPNMAEEYSLLWEDCEHNKELIEAAFAEAAKKGARPYPAWLRSVVERCMTDGLMPGEFKTKSKGRDSPTFEKRPDGSIIMPSGGGYAKGR